MMSSPDPPEFACEVKPSASNLGALAKLRNGCNEFICIAASIVLVRLGKDPRAVSWPKEFIEKLSYLM